MSVRATWKGYLKVSLVNVPVKVFPATESGATISFNQLHGEYQTRIQQKKWCAHCNREVSSSELVKGYEFEKGRYVVLSEEDFDKVKADSTRVIDQVDELNSVATTVKPAEAKLARQIIESFEGPLDLATYKDEYQEGLKAIIEAKIAGQEIAAPVVDAPPRVVNLMEALRKSLDAVSTQKKTPVKAAVAKPAPKKRARA